MSYPRATGPVLLLVLLLLACPIAAELAGFPLPLGGNAFSAPVVADFTADGALEVAVAVGNVAPEGQPAQGAIYLVDGAGEALPGRPVRLPVKLGTARMAAGDLQATSPGLELAIGTNDGLMHLFVPAGVEAPGFPVKVGAYCPWCVITSLDGGATPALVAVSAEGKVFALDADGKALSGWPKSIPQGLSTGAEVVDWDGDGAKDVLVLDKAGALHVLSHGGPTVSLQLSAQDFCTGDFVPASPGLEVLVTRATEGLATLHDHSGRVLEGWPVPIPRACLPTAVTLTEGGPLRAMVIEQAADKPERLAPSIHLMGAEGALLLGWPVTPPFVPGYNLYSRPSVRDVDGDGASEIILGHTCYAVLGLRADASDLAGFPIRDVGMVYGTPAVADLNGDGRYEVIFGDVSSIQSLHVFTMPHEYARRRVHQPTQAETARGFVLGEAAAFDTILPDAPAVEGELFNRLELTACRGEYEPATFVLHALRDLDVTLNPAELTRTQDTGDAAAVHVPAANLDVRFVHAWRQRRPSGGGEYRVPELLLKRDPGQMEGIISQPLTPRASTQVAAGTARQFWVTVRVPKDATPGVYGGDLTLTADGVAHRVPLRLRVLPMDLPANPFVHSIYFHGSSLGLGWYGEREMAPEAWLERARRQLADLRAHGMNAAGNYTPVTITTKGDELGFDLENLRRSVALHKEAGLTSWVVLNLQYSKVDGRQLHPALGPSFYKTFTELVAQVEELAQEGGWPPVAYYGVDEPMRKSPADALKYYGFEDAIDVCRRWFEAIREGGGRCTAAVYHSENGGWPILGPLCDVPIYSLGSIYPALRRDDLVRETQQRPGGQSWYYWQCWKENPLENRLLAGLYLCKSGLTGVMPWDYMGWSGEPYDDFDTGVKDMCTAYPSREGPVPTLAWEAFREGVDDCRYYALAKDRPGAQAVLDSLSLSNSHNCAALTARDVDALRQKLVDLALAGR